MCHLQDMYVDHRLMFHGYMRPAPPKPARGDPVPDFAQTVLFTDNPLLIAREAANVYNHRCVHAPQLPDRSLLLDLCRGLTCADAGSHVWLCVCVFVCAVPRTMGGLRSLTIMCLSGRQVVSRRCGATGRRHPLIIEADFGYCLNATGRKTEGGDHTQHTCSLID